MSLPQRGDRVHLRFARFGTSLQSLPMSICSILCLQPPSSRRQNPGSEIFFFPVGFICVGPFLDPLLFVLTVNRRRMVPSTALRPFVSYYRPSSGSLIRLPSDIDRLRGQRQLLFPHNRSVLLLCVIKSSRGDLTGLPFATPTGRRFRFLCTTLTFLCRRVFLI